MGNKHYIYILVLVCLCIPTSTLAQYNDQNYVRRVDLLKAYESDCDEDLGDDEQLLHRKTWQFYDDLGRPTILAKGGKNLNGTYSVSMTEYDKMGRKSKIWSSFDGGEDIEVGTYSALQDNISTIPMDFRNLRTILLENQSSRQDQERLGMRMIKRKQLNTL